MLNSGDSSSEIKQDQFKPDKIPHMIPEEFKEVAIDTTDGYTLHE